MSLSVRAMGEGDLDAVLRVQAQSYPPEMNESREVLAQRLQACPDTAWVLCLRGEVGAYLVGYRTQLGRVSPLGATFEHQAEANALYVHDLAIGLALRGQGAAQHLMTEARRWAREWALEGLALVSVNDTVPFWRKQGFEVAEVSPQGQQALDSYVGRALYMQASARRDGGRGI
jgi:GNAT superfamily N-acetyltransferase